MQLLFVHSHIFMKCNQNYYTTGQLPYELFETRYLNNFEQVTVCSRTTNVKNQGNLNQSNGKNVVIKSLPNVSIIKGRLKALKTTKEILKKEIKKVDVVVARMPSRHAYYAMKIAKEIKKPLVVEVVGDVFESFWNHGSVFGKILGPISAKKYKKEIKTSKYTIYVTKKHLQKEYPSARNAYTINASHVELEPSSKFILQRRQEREENRPTNKLKIGLIGSYSSKYKGIHSGVDLISYLNKLNIDAELHILGSGDNQWLLKRARKKNVINDIYFDGLLPIGDPVLEWLDMLDLYIQPSLTEGLPRALIEAMSRGLPAVGSNVGGIPELIEPKFLHKPNNSDDLINKVFSLIQDREEMMIQSEKNFIKAQDYSTKVLRKKRNNFWETVIEKELKS